MGVSSASRKTAFHYYYSAKDVFVFVVFFFIFLLITLQFGYRLIDAENFIAADALVTPTHIQPEWYFLFAYAILRSVPNKLGGVVALLLSVLVLFLFSLNSKALLFSGFQFSPVSRLFF